MLSAWRVAQEMYVITYTVSRIAIVARSVCLTGSILVKPHTVDWTGGAASPFQCSVGVLAHLVHSYYKQYILWPEGYCSHSVAVAVDVYNHPVLAYCVCTA